MSTKIYNAYEWSGDYQSLVKTLNEIKKLYIEDCSSRFSQHYNFDPSLGKFDNIIKLINNIQEDTLKLEKGYPFDVSFSCVVYMHEGKKVIHFFGLNNFLYPLVYDRISLLKDFSYWNNSDRPDDVSEEEFEDRGVWYEGLFAVCGSNIPSECGLTYECATDSMFYTIAKESYNKWKVNNEVK